MSGLRSSFDSGVLQNFLVGFRSPATRECYLKKLNSFLRFSELSSEDVVELARNDPRGLEHLIVIFIDALKARGASGSTIRQHLQALKHLLVMNDLENSLNWGKMSKLMPKARKVGLDRAPTKDEIRKLLGHADIRMKALILLLCSSGIRIGSVEYLRWKHLTPVEYKGYKFAKLVVPVSKGGGEAYTTFITPEAYETLKEYRRIREAEGEEITPESPLIRVVKWSRSEDKGVPLPADSKTLRNELHRLWERSGLRGKSGGRPHDVKAVHGFRKFFATRLENSGVGRLVVETLLGHKTSLASNYYKPSEDELLKAYVKGIEELTISEAVEAKVEMRRRLEERDRRLAELEREYLSLQAKLSEMEKELRRLANLLARSKKPGKSR
ncbi:MAG: site-specific integrase [Thermosphaera sp.]